MASREFEQSLFIAAVPSVVREHLASFEHHDRIHPMIVAVCELDPLDTGDGNTQVRRYMITDRMRIGPLTLRFTYLATISEDASGELVSDAYQRPRVHLHNTTRCEASDAGTLVRERVRVEAPRPLVGFVLRQAQVAHHEMLANLKALLESPVPTTHQL